MYKESRDDKYLSYFVSTKEVRDIIEEEVKNITVAQNYSNLEIKGFSVTGAERKEDSFIITTEIALFYLDAGSLSVGGKPLTIGIKKVYEIEYTVYKDTYFCCIDCNKVLEGKECECGGNNIVEINKKLVSRLREKGVINKC